MMSDVAREMSLPIIRMVRRYRLLSVSDRVLRGVLLQRHHSVVDVLPVRLFDKSTAMDHVRQRLEHTFLYGQQLHCRLAGQKR